MFIHYCFCIPIFIALIRNQIKIVFSLLDSFYSLYYVVISSFFVEWNLKHVENANIRIHKNTKNWVMARKFFKTIRNSYNRPIKINRCFTQSSFLLIVIILWEGGFILRLSVFCAENNSIGLIFSSTLFFIWIFMTLLKFINICAQWFCDFFILLRKAFKFDSRRLVWPIFPKTNRK